MELKELRNGEAQRWDQLIAGYPGAAIFHQKAWLDYLAASRGARIRLWEIRQGAQVVGYFCGGMLRKGPFPILGSPLRGWGTNFMGPVMKGNSDHRDFLKALDRLAESYGLAMTELEQRFLSEDALAEAGYECETTWTYLVELTPSDPDAILKRMDKARRYGIRRAMKLGLTVEDTDDPAMPEQYYEQFAALMYRKGLAPPYPREYPRLLFHHLRKANRLFALRVRDAQHEVVATGLFPYDDHTLYFWGGASKPEARQLNANDLLHWHAMCLGAERGLRSYDMSGWGRFKKEFGGELITLKRWHKCYWRSARWARRGYEMYSRRWIRIQRWWEGLRVAGWFTRSSLSEGDGNSREAAAPEAAQGESKEEFSAEPRQ